MVAILEIRVDGVPLSPSQVALPVEIQYGRSSPMSQPDAPTASFSYFYDGEAFRRGQRVEIDLAIPAPTTSETWGSGDVMWRSGTWSWGGKALLTFRRFTGRINSLVAVERNGKVEEWTVGCVGLQARDLARAHVRIDRPAETDVQRVAAISTAAGIPIRTRGTAAVELTPDSIDRDALAAVHEVCASSGGHVWEDTDGSIWYGMLDYRSENASMAITSGTILDGVEWGGDLGSLLNLVEVEFGPEGARVQNTYRDQESIDAHGLSSQNVDTKLANSDAADKLGFTIIARRSNPFWTIPGIIWYNDLARWSEWAAVNALNFGDTVLVSIPPAPGETPKGPYEWCVEGWTETWDEPLIQRMQFAITDKNRWGSSSVRTYADVLAESTSYGDWLDDTYLDMIRGVS